MASTSSELSDVSSSRRSSYSESDSVNSTPSILDRLKCPLPAEISRKRKVKSNPPPKGKRPCRGSSNSDPKNVDPGKRASEFPNQMLKVSCGKLFCYACREELRLKRSTIQNHINSQKHAQHKEKVKIKESREQDIAEALSKHNN